MAAPFQLPAGYWTTSGRDEFGQQCFVLHHEHFGELSDHQTYADAVYEAQDHADTLADEASEAAAAVAEAAYEATLDTIHAIIRNAQVHTDACDDAARGERRAIRDALKAIDGIGSNLSSFASAFSISQIGAR